ncbi:hypothetical protein [Gemmatimonas sp.]|uniref:hypothetical protein n=2 Tax=Gemmatimonas sp. TaxID=1962908 RepID=UPI003569D787
MHPSPIEASTAVSACWAEMTSRLAPLVPILSDFRLRVRVTDACRALAVTSRTTLSRELERRQLPPFRLLKNWCPVCAMVEAAENGASLCDVALHRGEYPAACYRLVKSSTGRSWTEVRAKGSDWVKRCALQAWEPYTRLRVIE